MSFMSHFLGQYYIDQVKRVLQCVRVFLCSTTFFTKVILFSKTVYLHPAILPFQVDLFTVDKKRSSHYLKKPAKFSQKRGTIIYLYKNLLLIFLIHLTKFYINHHSKKLSKIYSVNILHNPQELFSGTQIFIFALHPQDR